MRRLTRVKLASAVALLSVSASGCASVLNLDTALRCEALIPPSLREPVEDVPPPDDNTVGGWVAVADARSGKLDEANRRSQYLVESADSCAREQQRLQRRPWYAFFG